MRDRLALTSLLAFTLGIALQAYDFSVGMSLFVLLLSLIFLGAWFFGKRNYYLYPFFFLLLLTLGLLRGQFVDSGARAPLEEALGSTVIVEGIVTALPDERETSTRLTLYIPEYKTKILVVVARYPAYAYGDKLAVSGTLKHPEAFKTDGGRVFAYDKFLEKDGIAYLINYGAVEKTGENTSAYSGFMRGLFALRQWFVDGLNQALPEPASSLASGILLGGKQGLGTKLLEAFTRTGLLPVVVLSGYNIMIIAVAVLSLTSRLKKRISLPIAGIVITLFVIATGAGTSAVRALLMGLLALFARALDRSADALRILLATFVLMIAWNPLTLLHDPGFQFSFAATAGLIILSTPIATRLLFIRSTMMREIVSSTCSAQLFVLPLLLYQTGNLSFVSILANVLVLPVIPFAMLLSFIAGLFGALIPSSGAVIGLPAWLLLSYSIGVAELFARFPFAHVIIPAFPAWALIPSYVGLGWITLKLRRSASLRQSS